MTPQKLKTKEKVLAAALIAIAIAAKENGFSLTKVLLAKTLKEAWQDAAEDPSYEPSKRKQVLANKALTSLSILAASDFAIAAVKNKIASIASTEIFGAHNESLLKSLPSDSFVKYNATLDKRTCPTCASRDSRVYRVEDAPSIPAHTRCRCTYEPM